MVKRNLNYCMKGYILQPVRTSEKLNTDGLLQEGMGCDPDDFKEGGVERAKRHVGVGRVMEPGRPEQSKKGSAERVWRRSA